MAALLIVGAAVVVYLATSGQKGGSSSQPAVVVAKAADENVGEKVPVQTGTHISVGAKGNWASDPPSSGQHYNELGIAPVAWGTDQQLKPEQWVHNLEHGGIVILYSCPSGCGADTAAIRSFLGAAPQESEFHEVKLVVSPYAVPGHRFALLAWGWQMFLDSWDPALATKFYAAHVDRAPEERP